MGFSATSLVTKAAAGWPLDTTACAHVREPDRAACCRRRTPTAQATKRQQPTAPHTEDTDATTATLCVGGAVVASAAAATVVRLHGPAAVSGPHAALTLTAVQTKDDAGQPVARASAPTTGTKSLAPRALMARSTSAEPLPTGTTMDKEKATVLGAAAQSAGGAPCAARAAAPASSARARAASGMHAAAPTLTAATLAAVATNTAVTAPRG